MDETPKQPEPASLTVADIFRLMPERFNQHKAPPTQRFHYLFVLGSGEMAPAYAVIIADGKARVIPGGDPDPKSIPDLTITVREEDLRDILAGKLTAQRAFMEGKIRLDGNVMMAAALPMLFN